MSGKELWLVNQILQISQFRERGAYAAELVATGRISKRWAHLLLRRLCARGLLLKSDESPNMAREQGRPPRRYYRVARSGLRALNHLS
jgi:hypothetical protein